MRHLALGFAMLAIAGCAAPLALDEKSGGQTVEVEQGKSFTVALPGTGWRLSPPGGVVAPGARSRNEAADRDVFHLNAEAAGEVELRFSRPADGANKAQDCVIRIRVSPPSEFHMKPHTG